MTDTPRSRAMSFMRVVIRSGQYIEAFVRNDRILDIGNFADYVARTRLFVPPTMFSVNAKTQIRMAKQEDSRMKVKACPQQWSTGLLTSGCDAFQKQPPNAAECKNP